MNNESNNIIVKGARVNNLKNIDVEVPRGSLVVITGLSGSGKSSLAFDTLYAEGQRRYVESLSAYARQFLGRMAKPECDYIKGLPPAIAIEQKVSTRNSRSTVGSTTEIYEYLRLLFARVGKTISPVSGQEVKKDTVTDVVDCMLSYSPRTRFAVLCPTTSSPDELRQKGFARVEVNGEMMPLDDYQPREGDRVMLVVDRMAAGDEKENTARLADSAETAFREGNGEMMLKFYPAGIIHTFNTRFELDGITFEEPTDQLFSFNSPIGACPHCQGFGRIVGIDERLVIPDSTLSVYEGCVVCWRGEKMGEWKNWFIRLNADRGFPVHKPYYQLTQEEKDWLWHGTFPASLSAGQRKPKEEEKEWGPVSIDAFFQMLEAAQYKIQNRVMLARYRGKTLCPHCHGTRLKPEALYVKVGGRSISDLCDMPIDRLAGWFRELELSPHDTQVAARLLAEIGNRLRFLVDVGLGYLTLSRLSNSLSGGETQRINLATSLGSSLVGSMYILDEPSVGLHSRDTQRLIGVLKQLKDLGNTVVVVEHDEEVIRAADMIIDIGPEAGRLGGEVVYQGPPQNDRLTDEELSRSHTMQFLTGRDSIPVPRSRRPWNRKITLKGARANNLRGVDADFPLNVVTCITGVSGSGKSTLVSKILYPALMRHFDKPCELPGEFQSLGGDLEAIAGVDFIDQNPIGKSSRSNPVTYVKAWDEIRALFADQPLSRAMGYTGAHFSFNTDGGRCDECKGEGTVTVEMQFMADLHLTCESCHGKRFKQEILQVKVGDKNVFDVLNMTVNQAIEFFTELQQPKIVRRLNPLQDVGLGYIKLGQTSSTLSGGENQRVKLAYYLSQEKQQPTLFIFDEPTTGLHIFDIKRLMAAFNALILHGHTIIIIEHNLDVVKCADHVIDMGPEGGDEGGRILVQGTPEQVAQCPESYTGKLLKEKLKK